jgi:hypothetical protein
MARKGARSGWYGDSMRHSLASRGIRSGSKRSPRSVRRFSPAKVRVESRLTEAFAENAIRDMFFSRQYNKKIPNEDIEIMLNSPRWHSLYGEKELREAWASLIKEGFVHKQGNEWIWELE